MRTSATLMYATSKAAASSRWMPWELGYFDGLKGADVISICPIESGSYGHFTGQEYLGLYKEFEVFPHEGMPRPFLVSPDRKDAQDLSAFVNSRGYNFEFK
jgi:hypothetical protein